MQCDRCGYELWNIRGRTCPECGARFRPSDYEFRVGAVAFDCPGCGQSYIGTSEKGHLEPDRFNCVRCGQFVSMDDDAILRPASSDGPSAVVDRRIPWLRSENLSFRKRWWDTVRLGLRSDADIMGGVRPSDPTGVRFLLVSLLICAIALSVQYLVFELMGTAAPIRPFVVGRWLPMGGGFGMNLVVGLLSILTFVAMHLVGAYIWAGGAHLLLHVLGVRRPNWRRTQQAVFYSSGSVAGVGLPSLFLCMCLWQIAYLWWALVVAASLAKAHGIGRFRATVAALLSPILVAFVLFWLQYGCVAVIRAATPSASTPPSAVQPAPKPGPAPVTGGAIDGSGEDDAAERPPGTEP